jgi:hypothetical protein
VPVVSFSNADQISSHGFCINPTKEDIACKTQTNQPDLSISKLPFDRDSIISRIAGRNTWIDEMRNKSLFGFLNLLAQHRRSEKLHQPNEDLRESFMSILFAVHSPVLNEILQGDLARRYCSNQDVRFTLDALRAESAAHPVRPGISCWI